MLTNQIDASRTANYSCWTRLETFLELFDEQSLFESAISTHFNGQPFNKQCWSVELNEVVEIGEKQSKRSESSFS